MTKTLRPVLAMSIAALTLLAGCAKGDASKGFSAIKKAMKNDGIALKKVTHAEFIHTDAKKAAKKVEDKDAAKKIEEEGNSVAYFFTYTDKNGDNFFGTGTYGVKEKKAAYVVAPSKVAIVDAEAAAKATWDASVKAINSDYQVAGTLVK